MTKDKLLKLWRMINRQCTINGLADLLEFYGLTEEDWYWLENEIDKLSKVLEEGKNE